jgi:hypothetical protein
MLGRAAVSQLSRETIVGFGQRTRRKLARAIERGTESD